jgi:hypothetical protein
VQLSRIVDDIEVSVFRRRQGPHNDVLLRLMSLG